MSGIIKSFCTRCLGETNHKVVGEHRQDYRSDEISWTRTWQVIACLGCETGSFRELYSDSETFDEAGYVVEVKQYPPRGEHYHPKRLFAYLPATLRNLYQETVRAYNDGQGVLCAGGLRALVEGICADLEVEDGPTSGGKRSTSLQGKIDGLAEMRLLTEPLAMILHELRFMGNEALHELEPPSEDNLKRALNIVEHTIENVYEVPVIGSNLQRAREQRAKKRES